MVDILPLSLPGASCLLSVLAILGLSALFSLLHKNSAQPPLPHKLYLLGNLHQLSSLPHRSLRALALRHGPVMLLQLGRVPAVVVSSAAAAEEIMKTRDSVFATRPDTSIGNAITYGCRDVALAKYGEYWRKVRRVCVVHMLSVKQVQSFRPVREEEMALLVGRIRAAAGRPVNISKLVIDSIKDVFCRVGFGKKHFTDEEGGADRVHAMLAELVGVMGEFPMGDFMPWLRWIDWLSGLDARVRKITIETDAFMEKVLDDHIVRRKDNKCSRDNEDFVDILLSPDSTNGVPLDRDSIKAIILDMFSGGVDTSFAAVIWAMAELMKRPAEMRRAQEEIRSATDRKVRAEDIKYLQLVVKETLRLHPPLPLLLPREAREGAQLQGYEIQRGTRVIVNAWAIGRDPDFWERAEEFWPERFCEEKNPGADFKGQELHHLPFGGGRRGCPGEGFGIATVETVLANLLYHFDWEMPDGRRGEEMDLSETPGLIIHRRSDLILVPKPRPL